MHRLKACNSVIFFTTFTMFCNLPHSLIFRTSSTPPKEIPRLLAVSSHSLLLPTILGNHFLSLWLCLLGCLCTLKSTRRCLSPITSEVSRDRRPQGDADASEDIRSVYPYIVDGLYSLFRRYLAYRTLGSFWFGVVMNKTAMKIQIHAFFADLCFHLPWVPI